MSKRSEKHAIVPVTPTIAFASDGSPFDPLSDLWDLRTRSRGVPIDFRLLRVSAGPDLVNAVRRAVRVLVETRNLNTARAAFDKVRSLLMVAHQRRSCVVDEIDAEDIAAWIVQGNGRYLAQLRILMDAWRDLAIPGVDDEVFDFLDTCRVPSTDTLTAVKTWDPDAGPFRPAEDAVLKAALDDAFNEGRLSLYDYALARTFRGLGIRPAQAAALKLCDLRLQSGRTEIHIPVAKQRGTPERGAFLPWKPVTQGFADILFLHCSKNVRPLVSPDADYTLAPLFPPKRCHQISASENCDGHTTGVYLAKHHSGIFEGLGVISPLTARQIVVNPRRERHTVLTALAMNGCTAPQIAANAGHSDPRSCDVYVDASIDHFQRMERLVGAAFIPIADRFLGAVVRREVDSKPLTDPDSVLLNKEMTAVGSCQVGGCNAVEAGVAPIACYTCRKFRAWADAPHDVLLEELLAHQTRLLKEGHAEVAETKTPTIVAIVDLLAAIKLQDNRND